MKKKSLFLACFVYLSFVSIESFSQDNTSDTKKTRHELNIIVDDIFAKTLVADHSYYNDYTNSALNSPKVGLGYKLNFNNAALRTKISFGSNQNTSNGPANTSKSDYSSVATKFNIGYELQKDIDKLQIFYGLDVFLNYNALTLKNSSVHNSASYDSKSSSNTLGFGTSPFFGVKYFVIPNLSISTEINFSIESYKSSDKSSNQSNPETSTDYKGMHTRIGPIGNIGINLHF